MKCNPEFKDETGSGIHQDSYNTEPEQNIRNTINSPTIKTVTLKLVRNLEFTNNHYIMNHNDKKGMAKQGVTDRNHFKKIS